MLTQNSPTGAEPVRWSDWLEHIEMNKQPTLWEGERISLADSLDLTAQSLTAYGSEYEHWAIAFSGGKDSSATVAAVVYLLDQGKVKRPKSLTVLMSDTRMELPPLFSTAKFPRPATLVLE